MSDGREEREEQEQRRKWEGERDRDDQVERREPDERERERRDSKDADAAVLHASRGRTRRSFVVAAAAAAGGYGFYRWIDRSPGDQLIPRPLRKALNMNEAVSRSVFDERGLAPTYAVDKSENLRVNGVYGLKEELIPASYRLQVVGVADEKRFPQYVSDVTAWEYQYSAKKSEGPADNHDTKVAPKSGDMPKAKDDANGDAGRGPGPTAKGQSADRMTGGGGAKNGGEKADGDHSGGGKMPPAFEKAFAEMKKAQGDKRPRGQEEAGESDNTLDPGTSGLLLTMDDVKRLPRRELVTQFKCIEGWSQIVHWGGIRLADFIEAYPPEKRQDGTLPKYIYMETPDGDYYCGFELKECRHPQSLLVTEMAGQPLTQWHGAPLRLHMPIKYGYKQIKRIGLIAYTDMRPDDYWTKLGYDWYAGL